MEETVQKDIYDPLEAYVEVFHDRFKEVAEQTFAELAAEAKVDTEANQETCRKLYETEKFLNSLKSRINWLTAGCVILWIAMAACCIGGFVFFKQLEPIEWTGLMIASILMLVYLLCKVHPRLKQLKTERQELDNHATELKDEAWQQMAPLNLLYDWDVLTRMMSKTVPRLEFDPYFTTQRLADLQKTYQWDDAFNADRSVVYSHSGLINGNPFIICRTRKMEMGSKTYEGTKTITWTTRERGSDGKYYTQTHSEVLRAHVTAPYPLYFEKTRLIYGNTAAPDLVFHRKQSGLAGNENSLSFRWKKQSLRRKARNLKHADFAMMTNEEFEVAFNTSDRNNNQQFALLFTPLAQESMMSLLKDQEVGYGDNFDFEKHQMINTIVPNHLQELNLDMNPERYHHFDYEKAKVDFYTVNAQYFRAIYFSLAPLLCIPMYQQIRPHHDIYGRDMQRHSSFWEHEALANFWGQNHFKHPDCVTDCILKTEEHVIGEDESTLTVHAYGYRSEERLTYVSVWGGDGHSHRVPVYWKEYFPVKGTGQIQMKEDNGFPEDSLTQHQRLNHIRNVLGQSNLDLYRRHIASKVQPV